MFVENGPERLVQTTGEMGCCPGQQTAGSKWLAVACFCFCNREELGWSRAAAETEAGFPCCQYLLQLPFVLSLQWRQQQRPLPAPQDSPSPTFPLTISPSFSMSSNSLSLIPAPHPFVQNIAYNADNCEMAWELGVEWYGKPFLWDLKTGGNPGACVWNIWVGDQRCVPQGIAVFHCIAKFSEDAAVQASFPCCRAEGLWERACAQQSRSLLLRPMLRFSFYAFSKTSLLFHTFQIFLYFAADACRIPTFVWFQAWIKISNQCLEAKSKRQVFLPELKST